MGKKLGNLIRAARTDAGYTQEQLARKVKGVTQSDIGKFERGEAEPTTQNVKDIAKACGVTQKSLLDAMPKSTSKSTSSRTTSSKSTSSKSTSTASKSSMQVSSTERRLVELYREADSDTKKRALALLRGGDASTNEVLNELGDFIGDMLFKK